MAKPKVSAKGISADLKAGMSDAELRSKYALTEKQLESIFRKLVTGGLFTEAELKSRAPVQAASQPAEGKAAAVLADIKARIHKMEIMSRHELSPSQYQAMVDKLVQSGALPQSEPDAREPKKTTKCPFCSATIPVGKERCEYCNQWLDGRDATPERERERLLATPIVRQTLVSDQYCPWEDRESLGLVNAFFQTAVKCLLSPSAFFSELPLEKGYINPLIFGVVASWFGIFIGLVGFMLIKGFGDFSGLVFGAGVAFVLIVPFAFLGLLIGGLLVHGCLMLVGGATSGLQATIRVVSYSACTQVFSAVPVVGPLVSWLYGVVLTVIGLKQTHDTSTGRAVAAVLMPVGIGVIIAVLTVVPVMIAALRSQPAEMSATEYTGERLPADLCEALNTYVSDVEAAGFLDDPKEVQSEIQRAMQELAGMLQQHARHPNIREVQQKAVEFANARLLLAMKDKLGPLSGIAQNLDPERVKKDLMAMCGN